jgi:hypothetical protein
MNRFGFTIGAIKGSGSAAAPVIVSAVIENAAPTVVVLTFDKTVTGVVKEDFTLAGKTISDCTINDTVVSLTVTVAYVYGDVVTVDYVQDAGNVADFTGQAVTNNIDLDVNAAAFLTAQSNTDEIQKYAINKFVVDLKAINGSLSGFVDFDTPANSLLKTCYPFVGGSAAKHKYNLINPADSDAAFRMTFGGTVAHDGVGITPNGSNGYGDTKLNANTLDKDSHGLDLFIAKETDFDPYPFEFGVKDGTNYVAYSAGGITAANAGQAMNVIDVGNNISFLFSDGILGLNYNFVGLHQVNRVNANSGGLLGLLNKQKVLPSTSSSSGSIAAGIIYLGTVNGQALWSKRPISYFAIRNVGLSDSVNELYADAVYRLQNNLNRNVENVVIVNEGHSMMNGGGYNEGNPVIYEAHILNSDISTRPNKVYNHATSGITCDLLSGRKAARITPYFQSGKTNILVLWIGGNDVNAGTSGSGQAAYNYIKSYVTGLIADGWIPIVLTTIPCVATNQAGCDAETLILNNLIKTDLPSGSYYVDLNTIAELQNPNNSTYFRVDKLHLKAPGNVLVGDAIAVKVATLL